MIQRQIVDFGKTKIAVVRCNDRVSWDYYRKGRPPYQRLQAQLERRKTLHEAQ